MATKSHHFDIEVPKLGNVPVQVNYDPDRRSPMEITHRPPTVKTDPYLKFLSPDVVLVDDPTTKIPQYAVRRQKIITLEKDLLNQVLDKKLSVGIASNKEENAIIARELQSINENPAEHIIGFDCPDVGINVGETTVLFHWDEQDEGDLTFPDLLLFHPVTRAITRLTKQTNNFLLSVFRDDNLPPGHPPWTAVGPLNTQPSDFRTASTDDNDNYRPFNIQDKRPAVAVLDTGLKYNVRNLGEEPLWPHAYIYRDADGKDQQFRLAYQDPGDTKCGALLTGNLLGYCSLQAYRQPAFRANLNPPRSTEYTPNEVANSPIDDCRLFSDSAGTKIKDARHGSSITALIQQHGNNAPVLPVKAFDNMGFTTLFDVLNGFNYILHRRESANIRVVNASWICSRDEPLLREKIRQLMEVGVFVVAAAGNEGQTTNRFLDDAKVYPACYSEELPNVITVTSVRKSYFPPNLISRRGDSIIENLLHFAIDKLALFELFEKADDVLDALLPTGGYVAVENYSPRFVNVGVVSTFGYFRSPFWNDEPEPIRGSSFACAFVSAFVIRQLTGPSSLLLSGSPITAAFRQNLLEAMSGSDPNLASDYVAGGYFLAGYDID
jgi:hypothetical protein